MGRVVYMIRDIIYISNGTPGPIDAVSLYD